MMIDHEELRDSIRQLIEADGEVQSKIATLNGRMDAALWQRMAEMGWLGITVPEDQGGLGLSFAELSVVYEELGRTVSACPLLPTMLFVDLLAGSGDAALAGAYFPEIVAGQCPVAIQLPQEGAALPTLSNGRISGQWNNVHAAPDATLLVLPVVGTDGAATFVLLDVDTANLVVTENRLQDMTRSMATVIANGVTVSPDRVVQVSMAVCDGLFRHALSALGSDSLGGTQQILDMTIEYLKVRVQFDRPIGSFQALKHRCAAWKVTLEGVSALVRNAAALVSGDSPAAPSGALAAKLHAADSYAAVAGDAIQLHGGIGFTWEHPCHLYLKRAKLNQMLLGSSARLKDQLAALSFDMHG